MPKNIYEVVAQAARYWFLFLMVLIAWRSYRWLARDRRQRKKRLRLLPDAGYVGELVVLEGGGELEEGGAIPVPREGLLGCLRSADVCVPVPGVLKKHLWLYYDDKRGLTAEGFRNAPYQVDGAAPEGRRATLGHGARLRVGEALLRLRMFTGFEATSAAGRARGFGDEQGAGGNGNGAPSVAGQEAAIAAAMGAPSMAGHESATAAGQEYATAAAAAQLTPEQIAFIQQQWYAAQQAAQQAQRQGATFAPPGEQPRYAPLTGAAGAGYDANEGDYYAPEDMGDSSDSLDDGDYYAPEDMGDSLDSPDDDLFDGDTFAPREWGESPDSPDDGDTFAAKEWGDSPPDSPSSYYPFEADDEPDAEVYTGPDEAARAKSVVWDRFFGGRGREG